ncbi:uncharacterized protein [Branchiostoma lanceolatum]|uniref:uncharacterized protein n=1 Tax=Branchiostoma lanceolatum TaxID=7740 RepID=UPI003453B6A5
MAAVEKHLDETVRDQWESPVQWDARKKFILHNWDQHPEDQLVCLSNVWANIEFLGCRYNAVVEQRVKEMAAGMPAFQKPELPQSTADQQDDKRNRNDGGGYGGERDVKAPSDPPHKRLKHIDLKKMINFTSGGLLKDEEKKREEQPPVKQETEGGSFAVPTLSVQPSTSSACQAHLSKNWLDGAAMHQCVMGFSQLFVADGLSDDPKDAKHLATLSKLRQTNPVVKPKKAELTEDALTRTEMFGSKEAREEQIKETNIGYQMLRKMGWSGGGIGKEGREGIAEPIKVNVMKRRAGLGTATDLAEKQSAKAHQVVLNYVQPLGVATRIDPKTGKRRKEYISETGKPVPLPPTHLQGSSQGPPINSKTKTGARKPRLGGKKSLSDFVILENAENAICIMNSSAKLSKMQVKFDVNKNWRDGTAMYQCVVRINQWIVADAWSTNSKGIKHLAAEVALSKLRQTNPVVKPKKAELTEDALTRTEVFGSKEAGEEQIKEANIGLGTATDLAEKQSAKAHQVILNYVQSGREDDLVFSPELTSQERGAIHEIAKQYNLKHKSFGEGKKRYIVLMRRRSAQDVMAQAQFRPGQYRTVVGDGKYEVNLPQSSSWQCVAKITTLCSRVLGCELWYETLLQKTKMTDVEKHLDETVRDQWESPVQWDARKKFILHNWDQHPEDQLVCLSNVWANMEFLGCRYNSVVEQRVKEMAAGMPEVQKPELPQSTADQQDDKRKRNDGGCYGGKRDLKAPGDPPHKRLKHIDLKKMINFKSGGVLGEEGKKVEELPPVKQETDEGGSFAAPTFSVQPSTSSASCSMFSADEEQQKSDPGSKAENSTFFITKPSPSMKPHALSTDAKPSILPENGVPPLLQKKLFFDGLSEAVRSKYAKLKGQRAAKKKMHLQIFTQCVQQCGANPLYKIVEVNSSSTFVLETDRAQVLRTGYRGYVCDLYVEGVFLARGHGKGKVKAKRKAVRKALHRLRHHRSVGVATRIDPETGNLREEYITETSKPWNAENAIHILNSSAQVCKVNVTFDVNKNWIDGTAMHQCVVKINQTFVADGWSDNSNDAKHLAAEAAISKLRQTNPVVKPQKADLTEDALARTEVFGSKGAAEAAISKLRQTNPVVKPKKADLTEDALARTEVPGSKWAGEQQIKETNIGYQMLHKMGWSGGGIGKEGREGIAEPIKVNVMKRRAGLGTATDRAEKQSAKARPVILNNVQSGGVATRINLETGKLKEENITETSKPVLFTSYPSPRQLAGSNYGGHRRTNQSECNGEAYRFGHHDRSSRRTVITAKARQVILNYVQSGREDDLVFSPDLTSQERRAIREVAKQYNLQNKYYGKGKKRYLVIGRRRSAKDVIAHVQAQVRPGQYGTVVMDGKYEVSLPQSWSW